MECLRVNSEPSKIPCVGFFAITQLWLFFLSESGMRCKKQIRSGYKGYLWVLWVDIVKSTSRKGCQWSLSGSKCQVSSQFPRYGLVISQTPPTGPCHLEFWAFIAHNHPENSCYSYFSHRISSPNRYFTFVSSGFRRRTQYCPVVPCDCGPGCTGN